MTTSQLRIQMEQDCKRYTNEQIVDLIGRIVKDGNRGALNASESITAVQVLEAELALREAN
jgi:hypothetical protein